MVVVMAFAVNPLSKSIAQESNQNRDSFEHTNKELVDQVWQIVYQKYIDGKFNGNDWQVIHKQYLQRSYSSKEEAYQAIQELLASLHDRFTRFIKPEEYKSMLINPRNIAGIGVMLGVSKKTKRLIIINSIDEGPADKAGVLPEDILVKINSQITQGLNLSQVIALLQGIAGTKVHLTIERDGQEKNFDITREYVKIHSLHYSIRVTPVGTIGYIRLALFNPNVAREMRIAIKDLETKKVVGYILDLRNNSGGLLESVTQIAQLWLNKGVIFSTIYRYGEKKQEVANGRSLTDKPLVVLINIGADINNFLNQTSIPKHSDIYLRHFSPSISSQYLKSPAEFLPCSGKVAVEV